MENKEKILISKWGNGFFYTERDNAVIILGNSETDKEAFKNIHDIFDAHLPVLSDLLWQDHLNINHLVYTTRTRENLFTHKKTTQEELDFVCLKIGYIHPKDVSLHSWDENCHFSGLRQAEDINALFKATFTYRLAKNAVFPYDTRGLNDHLHKIPLVTYGMDGAQIALKLSDKMRETMNDFPEYAKYTPKQANNVMKHVVMMAYDPKMPITDIGFNVISFFSSPDQIPSGLLSEQQIQGMKEDPNGQGLSIFPEQNCVVADGSPHSKRQLLRLMSVVFANMVDYSLKDLAQKDKILTLEALLKPHAVCVAPQNPGMNGTTNGRQYSD